MSKQCSDVANADQYDHIFVKHKSRLTSKRADIYRRLRDSTYLSFSYSSHLKQNVSLSSFITVYDTCCLQSHCDRTALAGISWSTVVVLLKLYLGLVAGHVDADTDRAVQPQAVPGPVGGACFHADAGLHYLLGAEPAGLCLDLARWRPGQIQQLDAVHRYGSRLVSIALNIIQTLKHCAGQVQQLDAVRRQFSCLITPEQQLTIWLSLSDCFCCVVSAQ